MRKEHSEFGGCLHFEKPYLKNGGFYNKYSDYRIDVDSGRSALQYIIERYRYKRIWLPVYNCPLVGQRISAISDIKICWYNLKDDFYPDIINNQFLQGDCLVWVNYCGVMQNELVDKIVSIQDNTPVKIIVDNIPAYFSEPRMNAINLYSCRKFIGVPDGGHIIGNVIKRTELPTYSTAENYIYLLKAIESGSNSAYDSYNESEKRFKESKVAYGMPFLTKIILDSIDYNSVITKRKDNFKVLHDSLGSRNRLTFNTESNTPLVYPYLCSDKKLRKRLLDNKIYISRFWKHVLTNELANDFERDLAEYLIPLPIDQRYEENDMDYIARMVKKLED